MNCDTVTAVSCCLGHAFTLWDINKATYFFFPGLIYRREQNFNCLTLFHFGPILGSPHDSIIINNLYGSKQTVLIGRILLLP